MQHQHKISKSSEISCDGCGKINVVDTEVYEGYEVEVSQCSCGHINSRWSENLKKPRIKSETHRHFFVDGKLEFSLFFYKDLISKDEIIQEFLNSSDWKEYERLYKVKAKSYKFSQDLLNVNIKVE